jgi:hypothetical protein
MGEQELRILCISDLQYLGSTEGVYGNTPVGMALSRDGRLLAVSTISGDYLPESGSQVMVFDLSTRSPFYWNWIYALPPLAFLPQDDGVLLAQPMTVVSFIPRIIVEYPSPGTPTYFTPRQIAFRAETMTLVSAEASLTIDGQPISLFGYNNGFSAELTTVLADGLHVLEARATSAFGTGSLTWNFTIDRSGATTPLPMVVPLTPLDGAILIANTTRVGFDLIYPDAPERPYLLYVMTLNGVELEMHQNSEHVYVGISTYACQMGENHVTVRLSYDGRWQWLNWTFLILSKPSL